jgi:hypothetical protein
MEKLIPKRIPKIYNFAKARSICKISDTKKNEFEIS